jgi:hypothetical protein
MDSVMVEKEIVIFSAFVAACIVLAVRKAIASVTANIELERRVKNLTYPSSTDALASKVSHWRMLFLESLYSLMRGKTGSSDGSGRRYR